MAEHNDFGELGENIALEYLTKKGYKVLDKNWRYLKAEVDIIAQKEKTLVIVEVKTRSSDFFGNPETFVSKAKIKLLIAAANAYVDKKDLDVEVRFDVIAIVKNNKHTQINHIQEAFVAFE